MPTSTTLTAATWNLWWRFGPWEERLPRIIEELRRVDADVVSLQEVWGADGTTSAAVIAAELGYEQVFDGTLELSPGVIFGNAVLSRWPITGHESRPLPAIEGQDELRNVIRADVDGPRGPLQVYSTHLNYLAHHSSIRQQQVRAVAEFVHESRPRTYPAIVGGDFNAEPHSVEIGMLTGHQSVAVDGVVLRDTWRNVHPSQPGFTWNNINPFVSQTMENDARIDYLFTTWPHEDTGAGHSIASELIGTRVIDGMFPSDHFGIKTTLRY